MVDQNYFSGSPKKVLRLPAVKQLTGLSKSSIYAYIAEGRFPAPFCIGKRAVGWDDDEVQAWIQSRIDGEPYQLEGHLSSEKLETAKRGVAHESLNKLDPKNKAQKKQWLKA